MSNKSWSEGSPYRHKDELPPDTVRPQRGKKNTKKWCKGKVGVEHTPVMVYAKPSYVDRGVKCHESKWLRNHWVCYHLIECTTCGKHLNTTLSRKQCPDGTAISTTKEKE